ncbi:integrase [Chroococcidiopsis cubana CCALA 043]|uniref:tyrosine-type recombinase/integrase n=1 Tax=Chroococcidiopsis cubana TaxID=171392 RepID=UPI000D0790CB|nr:site-specific integrase [Chroococcidiopsis cubana]PSB60802.1 integrase [Chroococcidiopsis cubana CCALA 043]
MSTVELKSLVLSEPLPLSVAPAAVYLSTLGQSSRRTMKTALDAIAALLTQGSADHLTLDWAALRYKHTSAIRFALSEKYSPATANKMLGALRRVLKEALLLDLIDPQDYQKAIAISDIKFSRELRGRALTRDEVSRLIDSAKRDPNPVMGARDAALMAILRGGGLRREEAVTLELKDLNTADGSLRVRRGKGNKERTVYLPPLLLSLVEDWISIRGKTKGALLCHVRKGRQVVVRSLTPQSVWFVLKNRALEAGVDDFSPHDFRRTFISELLDASVDIVTVQQLAGHSDPGTTARYDRRKEETKRRAVQVLDLLCL